MFPSCALDVSLLLLLVRFYLLRDYSDGRVSVWWEKLFSACLLIL